LDVGLINGRVGAPSNSEINKQARNIKIADESGLHMISIQADGVSYK